MVRIATHQTQAVFLSHELSEDISIIPGQTSPRLERRTVARPGGGTAQDTVISVNSHTGTHVDAPAHFFAEGRGLDTYAAEDLCGRCWLLDLSNSRARSQITLQRFLAAFPADSVGAGDFVFAYTGWARHFRDSTTYLEHPYFEAPIAEWLATRGVGMFGVDTPTPDLPIADRAEGFVPEVHRTLLQRDILIAENLGGAIADVVGQLLPLVVAAPIRTAAGDGGPATIIGFVDTSGKSRWA